MRLLVTGASGFVGSAFVRAALAAGHAVGVLARTPRSQTAADSAALPLTFAGSLSRAPWRDIAAFAPEACVHLAWNATPGCYLESPENHVLVEQSLDFLRRARAIGVRHIVAAGTCIEYQPGEEPLEEERTALAPASTYARCKDKLRRALQAEAGREDFGFCWGRIFYPYGPDEHPLRLCSLVIDRLERGETVELKTPASRKDYIYQDDLAAAILRTLEVRYVGPVNWATGHGVTIRTLAATLARLVGRPELVTEAAYQGSPDSVVADTTRLRALGWTPATGLEAGLRQLLARRRAPAERTSASPFVSAN